MFIPSSDSSEEGDNNTKTPLDSLNKFLESRDVSPVRHKLTKPWADCSERTKRAHTRKARQSITAVLEEIAPSDPGAIWNSVCMSQAMQQDYARDKRDLESKPVNLDITLLDALTECYKSAPNWQTRRQILSIITDKVDFPTLQQWLPDLTRYRYSIAKRHFLVYGRGAEVRKPFPGTRMKLSTDKVEHFISFITSPHIIQDLPFGEKIIKLSTKEVIKVPNVIRMIVPERILRQYQAYCQESGFNPMSRSTLLRVLNVCSASVRKSLQGLDYISASGAEAFDDLDGVAEMLGDNGQGLSWAKRIREHLKSAKRYLKTDYKVNCII